MIKDKLRVCFDEENINHTLLFSAQQNGKIDVSNANICQNNFSTSRSYGIVAQTRGIEFTLLSSLVVQIVLARNRIFLRSRICIFIGGFEKLLPSIGVGVDIFLSEFHKLKLLVVDYVVIRSNFYNNVIARALNFFS